jgi:hypothetical protein
MKLKDSLNESIKAEIIRRGSSQETYRVTKGSNEKWTEKKVKSVVGWSDYLGGKMPPLDDEIDEIIVTRYTN